MKNCLFATVLTTGVLLLLQGCTERRGEIHRTIAQIPQEVLNPEEEKLKEENEKEVDPAAPKKKFPVGIEMVLGHWVGSQPTRESYQFTFHKYGFEGNPYGILDSYGYKTVQGSPGETFYNLWMLFNTPSNSKFTADHVDQFFGLLKSTGSKLPEELKLSLLLRLGSKLGSGYDYDFAKGNPQWTQDIPLDQLYINARNNGDKGGICGNIHQFLREAANALGFESFAYSVNWRQEWRDFESGAHIVAGYWDPKSGNVYVQNYDDVILIGKADRPQPRMIIDAAHLFLSGFTATSMIEDAKGNMHLTLTSSGMMALSGIRQAQLLSMPTRDKAAVRMEMTSQRIDFSTRIDLDPWRTTYLIGGYNKSQGIGPFNQFQQAFVGFGFGENTIKKGIFGNPNFGLYGNWDSILGVQQIDRTNPTPKEPNFSLAEHLAFLTTKLEGKIFYIDPRNNTEYYVGSEVTYNSLELSVDKRRGTVFDGNGSDPWNWIRNYALVSKKISKHSKLELSVSEVRQMNFDQIQTYTPLQFKQDFVAGQIDFIHTGDKFYLKVGSTLYWTHGGGRSVKSSLEWLATLARRKTLSISAYGSGSFGRKLKDSNDVWFNIDDYETGRVGAMAEFNAKKMKTKFQFGGGLQYQGNRMQNLFDPRDMQNIREFLVNPSGPGGFAFIRVKF
ncbi:MAG: hypothetical protein JNL01_10270 [Bdellovibrionales bacterium]|nr:hypothetical protein [Bdellovibrionales bacterium]